MLAHQVDPQACVHKFTMTYSTVHVYMVTCHVFLPDVAHQLCSQSALARSLVHLDQADCLAPKQRLDKLKGLSNEMQ